MYFCPKLWDSREPLGRATRQAKLTSTAMAESHPFHGPFQSLQTIKAENAIPPVSPRKCSNSLRCAVLTKSPLKDCKTGKMFTMNLCDQDTRITTRAVCFTDKKFDELQVKTTYDISKYKLKKAYGRDDLEVLLDESTDIVQSQVQFNIEKNITYQYTILELANKKSYVSPVASSVPACV